MKLSVKKAVKFILIIFSLSEVKASQHLSLDSLRQEGAWIEANFDSLEDEKLLRLVDRLSGIVSEARSFLQNHKAALTKIDNSNIETTIIPESSGRNDPSNLYELNNNFKVGLAGFILSSIVLSLVYKSHRYSKCIIDRYIIKPVYSAYDEILFKLGKFTDQNH